MPNPIKITPAVISKTFDGKFFNIPPSLNPKSELKKVISKINIAGFIILFPYKASEIPAEKASILVAIPIKKRHAKLIQQILFVLVSKASLINLKPKTKKMVNTIYFA